ncbi:MAG: DUF3305 domain-containing protein [Gammaproteobacteria bacterium]|nr:DUF3305 domain-containing protein [Gammaproteobacteria bacterium]
MQENSSDHFSASAVMLKQASKHPWGDELWSLSGLVPGLSPSDLSEIESRGEVHIWPDLIIKLYPLHCDSYYHNLSSEQPKIYLVCSQDDSAMSPKPHLLTVDYDEAASYMETGEEVFNTALPEALCKWLERFVLMHYQPEKSKKRRRQKWHDADKK